MENEPFDEWEGNDPKINVLFTDQFIPGFFLLETKGGNISGSINCLGDSLFVVQIAMYEVMNGRDTTFIFSKYDVDNNPDMIQHFLGDYSDDKFET